MALDAEHDQCRICLETRESRRNDLVSPCSCSGSLKYVHERCLIRWFEEKGQLKCELCTENFKIEPRGFRPLRKWRCPTETCKMDRLCLMFIFLSTAILAFASVTFWMASLGCTEVQCLVCYGFLPLIVAYIVICVIYAKMPRGFWRTLLAMNRSWKVVGGRALEANVLPNKLWRVNPKESSAVRTCSAGMEQVVTNLDYHTADVDTNRETRNLHTLEYFSGTYNIRNVHPLGLGAPISSIVPSYTELNFSFGSVVEEPYHAWSNKAVKYPKVCPYPAYVIQTWPRNTQRRCDKYETAAVAHDSSSTEWDRFSLEINGFQSPSSNQPGSETMQSHFSMNASGYPNALILEWSSDIPNNLYTY